MLVEFGSIEIKVDKNGNLYLASDLRHPADMDPGPGVQMLTPIGAKDAFIIKLDGNGKLVWAKQFGGPGDTVPDASAITIDKDNNVIVCGLFNNTVDFDPGPATFNLTSTAHQQAYIAKLSGNGDFIWAKQFGNSPIVYSGAGIADVECDPMGNIYTMGGFAGACDFDPGTAIYSLKSFSLRDAFISKLDAGGNFTWAKRVGPATGDYYQQNMSRGIVLDSKNNVYTTGLFFGTQDFDPGPNEHNVTSLAGTSDFYLLKLNEQGIFLWVNVIAENANGGGADVAVDTDDNVYAVGEFGTSVDFDPGPGEYIIKSAGYGASALTKFSSNGSFIYAAPFHSIGDYGSTLLRRLVVDTYQNIYITGYFGGTIDFDPTP